MVSVLIIFILIPIVVPKIVNFGPIFIRNLQLIQCLPNEVYPVVVSDVSVEIEDRAHIKFSGSLYSEIDLDSPISGRVNVKRRVWGVWVPIPCEGNIGSCDYRDLCIFGENTDENCPEIFQTNNVPCRCPIAKGNYTIPSTSLDINSINIKSIVSGKYKGEVSILQNEEEISCYYVYFELYTINNNNNPSIVLVNNKIN